MDGSDPFINGTGSALQPFTRFQSASVALMTNKACKTALCVSVCHKSGKDPGGQHEHKNYNKAEESDNSSTVF